MNNYREILLLFVASLTYGCGNSVSFHARCDTLAISSRLDYRLEFDLDPKAQPLFMERIGSYLSNNGFVYQKSSGILLGPPDDQGRQERYRNFKAVGCDRRSIVWVENPATSRHFVATIHRTAFGDGAVSFRRASDMRRVVSGTPHSGAITLTPISNK